MDPVDALLILAVFAIGIAWWWGEAEMYHLRAQLRAERRRRKEYPDARP